MKESTRRGLNNIKLPWNLKIEILIPIIIWEKFLPLPATLKDMKPTFSWPSLPTARSNQTRLTIAAIQNHFVRNEPDVFYMHISGMGSEKKLAQSVKAILDKVTEIRGVDPSNAKTSTVENTLNTKMNDSILGFSGTMNNGVYKITIGQSDVELDVELKEHGAPVSTFLGFNTWASWQGTAEKAAVAGDFTMTADEVAPVIKALAENDIEVVAVHKHMVHENPRIFFLYYWGVGHAEKLARGLRKVLDQTGVKNE
jgi:hypothetical protein